MKDKISPIRTVFIKNVNQRLKILEINPNRLCKELVLSENYVRNVLNGKGNITLDNCNQIIIGLEKIAKEKKISIPDEYFI